MLVALLGKARAGKDEFAKVAALEFQFIRVAFADELKQIAKILFPEHFERGTKPRELLIQLGMKMREIDPDVWVNAAERLISVYQDYRENVVVTDCRFPNEYQRLKELGAVFVRIEASEANRIERMQRLGETTDYLNDESERYLDRFQYDYLIENNGTLKDFRRRVRQLLREIMKWRETECFCFDCQKIR